MSPRRLSGRVLSGMSAVALAAGLSIVASAPAHADLTVCNDHLKVKNISCNSASDVVSQALGLMEKLHATSVQFDGWTCKRSDPASESIKCAKSKNGKRMKIKYAA